MNTPFWTPELGTWKLVLTPWKAIGIFGAVMFASRWFVQVYYSRKAGRPVTPPIFWIMSVAGSLLLLSYFFFSAKQDIVGIINNLFPCFIAVYNLILELRYQKKVAAEKKIADAAAAAKAKPTAASARISNRMTSPVPANEAISAK